MNIDWSHFTPYSSLAGGILIGLAARLLILADGRIAGISGIVSGLANHDKRERRWRATFVAGLLILPWLYRLAAPLPEIRYGSHSWILLAIAGLLVGFGSRLGSRCTSGHSVCGLSRLSKRSLVATVLFMVSGALSVLLVRHWTGV
ncbi:YeeE/YedE family protein [Oxalobacter aliiformigenes]|uniref:YeeE/YedE family protein n=1 Tax=Oxalobacter aliiformigenes TaxID=2946593 RepID=UPI0022AEE539|nr:YeeE/YedE family protein [Oxalobacter aliiformigenes]MCZ4065576.1 YeeE/YedE family protein [Oxalobacter aliiformigenes]WAW00043.1 YeeE/YedE family protein [Oxalobacter aliiformigenes]